MSKENNGNRAAENGNAAIKKTTTKSGSRKSKVPFKVDRSPAARAMSRAFAMTQKRLLEEKTNGNNPISQPTQKNAARKEDVPFKVDRSPASRAFARAVKLTHKRLYGEK
jgi:hypothetical protein